jgi:hypothetical protein
MTNPNSTIDRVFARLVAAPDGLDASNSEVLAALGMLASGILHVGGFADPLAEVDRFCRLLKLCVHKAVARDQQHSAEMATQH